MTKYTKLGIYKNCTKDQKFLLTWLEWEVLLLNF